MTEEDKHQNAESVDEIVTARVNEIVTVRLGRAVESIASDFSDLRQDMNRRFELLEQCLERFDTRLAAMSLEISGMGNC